MKIYRDFNDLPNIKTPVVTIGTFDGIHLGHQQILEKVVGISRDTGGESVLVTFHPHPRIVLQKGDLKLKFLNTFEEKLQIIERTGIDHCIVVEFTKEFAQISAKDFVVDYLIGKIRLKKLIVGYDHHFGSKGSGNYESLLPLSAKYGFDLQRIQAESFEGVNISSTKIRNLLAEGKIKRANDFLGYHYQLQGHVIEGNHIGADLGFPTANIQIDEIEKPTPSLGVYAVLVHLAEQSFGGMLNIGIRPTLKLKEPLIEVHLFDFNGDLYGKELRIEFIERIRDELKFESLNRLKQQLKLDKQVALKLLSHRKLL